MGPASAPESYAGTEYETNFASTSSHDAYLMQAVCCCVMCNARRWRAGGADDCQLTLSILRDFHRQLDWNISAERPLSTTIGGTSGVDQSQTSDSPEHTSTVNHDVILQRRQYTASDMGGRTAAISVSRLSLARWWRPHGLVCAQPRTIQR